MAPHTLTVGEYTFQANGVGHPHPFQEVRDKVGLRSMVERGESELELICQLESRDEHRALATGSWAVREPYPGDPI